MIGHNKSVFCLLYLKNNNILFSGSLDHEIILWDISSGKAIKTLRGHNRSILKLVNFQDKNMIGSFGYDNQIIFWDYFKGKKRSGQLITDFKRNSTYSPIYHYYASICYINKSENFFFSFFNDVIKVRDSKIIRDET